MSIDAKANEVLWVERYRPQKIDETILPEKTKAMFKSLSLMIVYQTYCCLVVPV